VGNILWSTGIYTLKTVIINNFIISAQIILRTTKTENRRLFKLLSSSSTKYYKYATKDKIMLHE